MHTERSKGANPEAISILYASFEETEGLIGKEKNTYETSSAQRAEKGRFGRNIQKQIFRLTSLKIGYYIDLPSRIVIVSPFRNSKLLNSLEYDTKTGEMFEVLRKDSETFNPIHQSVLSAWEWLDLGNNVIEGLKKFTENSLGQMLRPVAKK